MVHQGGRALIPALSVHVCPGLAALGPPVQPVGAWGIVCVLARIMAHTDTLIGYRVCRRTLRSCWQSIHKSLLPVGPFSPLPDLPVCTEFGGSKMATNRPQGRTPLLCCTYEALTCARQCAVHHRPMDLYSVGTKVQVC